MEYDPRIGSSSNMIKTAQAHILTTKVTLQKALAIGKCLMNVQEGRKLKNIKEKSATTALNALQLLFWLHLCGEDL